MNENLTQETVDLLESRKSYHYQHIPYNKDGNSGVYLIKFPNGKRYVGSSNHVFKRLERHLLGLESQYKDNTLWYCVAAIENRINRRELYDYLNKGIKVNMSNSYEIDYKYLDSKFELTPPPQDPRNKRDKRGHRIGNRVKEKDMKQYYKDLAEWKDLVEREKNSSGYYDYEAQLLTVIENDKSWKRKDKLLSKLTVNIFYCDDYREFESAILKSIPEDHKKFWYNSIFK